MTDKFKIARNNLKAERMIYQLPSEQVEEIKMDLINLGLAKALGEEYELLKLRTANKYKGRRRKLFDTLLRERAFEACVEAMLARLPTAADQPMGDAAVELGEG